MDEILNSIQIDKNAFSVASLVDHSDDREHWANASVQERWAAMEYLRVINYGYDPATERLQRVLTIVELGER